MLEIFALICFLCKCFMIVVLKITLVQESENSLEIISSWSKGRESLNCIGQKHWFLKIV